MCENLAVMRAAGRCRSLALGALLAVLIVGGIILPLGILAPRASVAASGISITGSFYRQPFVIPRGGSAFGPSIYVVVSNQGTDAFSVRMVTAAVTSDNVAEPGISINLSRVSFSLQPGAQQRVDITVAAAEGVPAGDYEVSVTAESYQDSAGGITLSGSAGQTASLTVSGEAASATVSVVGPSGQPVIAQVRLFRMVNGAGYEVASSNTGTVQAKVAPGTFSAEAYSLTTGNQLCDPATFDIAGGEAKTVTLTARTVYFENDFVVNANYDSQTKQLLNARTLATLTNVLEMMGNTEVRLVVTRDGDPLEEITVLGPLSLPTGQTGVPWNYIPAEGWKSGQYAFKYRLYVGGLFIAETAEQTLNVGGGGGVSSWMWLILVVLGVVGVGGFGLAIFSVVKNRREKEREEKPRKEKKRKEEKAAPKPEPARKPETVRAPQPVRQPEPVVEAEAAEVSEAEPVEVSEPAEPPPVAAPRPAQAPKPVQPARPAPVPRPVQPAAPVQQPRPVQGPRPAQAPNPVQAAQPVQAVRPAQAQQPVQRPAPVRPAQPARAEQPAAEPAKPLAAVSSLRARMASLGQDQRLGRDTDDDDTEAEEPEAPVEEPEAPVDTIEVSVVAEEPPPEPEPEAPQPEVEAEPVAEAEPAPEPEPEPAPVEVVEEAPKPPVVQKPVAQKATGGKPSIISSVTASKVPPKGAAAQKPPVKPEDEIIINWPPKTVERPRPVEPPRPGQVPVSRPPEAARPVQQPQPAVAPEATELPESPVDVEEPAPQETAPETVEAGQAVAVPEEMVPTEQAAPVGEAAVAEDVAASEEAAPAQEAATEEPAGENLDTEAHAPEPPLMKSSFVEAAKLRMQARERASVGGGGEDDKQPPTSQ